MADVTVSRKSWGGWEWFGLVVICVIFFAIALPPGNTMKHKAKEAEVKQNLHMIQLAVERFAVDTEGVYPSYLIGGAPAAPNGTPGTISFTSDVLLREGYLDSYPKNPFMRSEKPRSLEMQADLPSSIMGNDPLRPGDPEGDVLGYRFGADGSLMGQVLCDPRYEKWFVDNPLSGEREERDTWAIIEYPFWDSWNGKRHEPKFLPGMFFYKSIRPIAAQQEDKDFPGSETFNEHLSLDGDPLCLGLENPNEVDQYIMGAYGSIRTKGKDVLGAEQLFDGSHKLKWTRSAYSVTNMGGSPFSNTEYDLHGPEFPFENPNGIRDGIILILDSGYPPACSGG